MKKILFSLCLVGQMAHAQISIFPATQSEVDAGVVTKKYVSPKTLHDWSGGGGGGAGVVTWGTNATYGLYTNVGNVPILLPSVHLTNGLAVINLNKTPGMLRVMNNGVSSIIESNRATFGVVTSTISMYVNNVYLTNRSIGGNQSFEVARASDGASTPLYATTLGGNQIDFDTGTAAHTKNSSIIIGFGGANVVFGGEGAFFFVNAAGALTNAGFRAVNAVNGFGGYSNQYYLAPTNLPTSGQVITASSTTSPVWSRWADSGSGATYKKYVAQVTQSGTGDPSVTVLENSLGTVTWARSTTGSYTITCTGGFPSATKWVSFFGNLAIPVSSIPFAQVTRTSSDVLTVTTATGATPASTDGVLSSTSFELIVYP